jgi:hypothetical protein
MTMNSFDSVCVEELAGYEDFLAIQELQAAEMAEFAEWIDTTLPASEELDQWFEVSIV